ncbi:hypothetical protein BR93DRAFT_922481 [Coniochaeta sp. PMI_546]|nr:hypothetical protein BR93DRAFT_922481 [Coniochaeta sp. PMI_546]
MQSTCGRLDDHTILACRITQLRCGPLLEEGFASSVQTSTTCGTFSIKQAVHKTVRDMHAFCTEPWSDCSTLPEGYVGLDLHVSIHPSSTLESHLSDPMADITGMAAVVSPSAPLFLFLPKKANVLVVATRITDMHARFVRDTISFQVRHHFLGAAANSCLAECALSGRHHVSWHILVVGSTAASL